MAGTRICSSSYIWQRTLLPWMARNTQYKLINEFESIICDQWSSDNWQHLNSFPSPPRDHQMGTAQQMFTSMQWLHAIEFCSRAKRFFERLDVAVECRPHPKTYYEPSSLFISLPCRMIFIRVIFCALFVFVVDRRRRCQESDLVAHALIAPFSYPPNATSSWRTQWRDNFRDFLMHWATLLSLLI